MAGDWRRWSARMGFAKTRRQKSPTRIGSGLWEVLEACHSGRVAYGGRARRVQWPIFLLLRPPARRPWLFRELWCSR